MSLTASERRALVRIENVLQSRDPRLRSLFAIFTRLTWHEAMPRREQLRQRRPRAALAFPVGFMLIVAIIVVGSLSGASRACVPVPAAGGTASPRAVSAADQPGRLCPPRSDARPSAP